MNHFLKIIIFLFLLTKGFSQTQSGEIVLKKNASILWSTNVFKESEHKVEICKTELGWEFICKIDDKPWFGSDLGMEKPDSQLIKLILKIDNQIVELDVSGMFNTNYLTKDQFLLKKEGEFYKLYAFFSDGAGSYTAHWLIINGSSIREVISSDEKYFLWQNEK